MSWSEHGWAYLVFMAAAGCFIIAGWLLSRKR